MIIKCHCHHCQGGIEYEAENAGQSITCPHCSQLTVLSLPVFNTPQAAKSVQNSRLTSCAHCGQMIARKAHECPNCGGPTPNKPSVFYYVFVGVVSLVLTCIILAVIGFIAAGVLAGIVSKQH